MSDPHSAVAHQFDDFEQQTEASRLGMWAFLVTEIMFFGGLFTGYTMYRSKFPEAFAAGSHHLDVLLGAINTAVLIASSLTMALAVNAAEKRHRRRLIGFLVATMVLGSVFLGIKAVEYGHKFEEHLIPGRSFQYPHSENGDVGSVRLQAGGNAPLSERALQLFFSFYFAMTGVHAVHMVIGVGILGVLVVLAARGRFEKNVNAVENTGLYWHFVDIVWIFLFPLLYLIERHA